MPAITDHYLILGVARDSSAQEIKQAYREKAHEFHPDKQNGNETRFKEINEAYQILGDSLRREAYDRDIGSFVDRGFGGTGMTWEQFKVRARSQSATLAEEGEDGVVGVLHSAGDIIGELFDYND